MKFRMLAIRCALAAAVLALPACVTNKGPRPFAEPTPLVTIIGPVDLNGKIHTQDLTAPGNEEHFQITLPSAGSSPATLDLRVRAYFAHVTSVTGGNYKLSNVSTGSVSSAYFQ